MKTKNLTVNSVFYLIYNVLNVLFPLIIGIYVARVLSPTYIGEVSYAQNIVSYFVIFSFLGIPTYGMREVAKNRGNKEELNKLFTELFIINLISTIVFLSIFLGMVFIVSSFRERLALYLVCGLSIAINSLNISWLFEGLEEFKYISIRSFFIKILSFVALVIFVKANDDYLLFALIGVLGTSGAYILNCIKAKKYVRFSTKDINIRRHLKPVFFLVIINLAIEIYTLVDITMLGIFCDKESVAFYSYASKIYKVLLHLINTFTMVIVPRISLLKKEGKDEEYNRLLTKTLLVILVLALPMIVGIFFTSDYLVTIIYGNAYIRSSVVLKILSLNLLISPIGYLLGSRVMLVNGKEDKMVWCVLSGAIANLLLNLLFINLWLEVGAAIASVCGEIVVLVVYLIFSHKFFKLEESLNKSTTKILIASLIISFFLYAVSILNISSMIITIVQIIGAVLIYFVVLLITKEQTVCSYYEIIKNKFLRIKKNDL